MRFRLLCISTSQVRSQLTVECWVRECFLVVLLISSEVWSLKSEPDCVLLYTNRSVFFRYLLSLCLKARNKQANGVMLLTLYPHLTITSSQLQSLRLMHEIVLQTQTQAGVETFLRTVRNQQYSIKEREWRHFVMTASEVVAWSRGIKHCELYKDKHRPSNGSRG
jgi:hypothetical protein